MTSLTGTSEGNPDWMVAQQTAHVATVNKESFAKVKSSLQELSGNSFIFLVAFCCTLFTVLRLLILFYF